MRIGNLRTRILLALYTALARMFSTLTTISHLIGTSPQLDLPPGATPMEVKMASKVISAPRGSRKLWASLMSWFVRMCWNSLWSQRR